MQCKSWSCYFGLGLGLKNLVLFTSLIILKQGKLSLTYLMLLFFRHTVVVVVLKVNLY